MKKLLLLLFMVVLAMTAVAQHTQKITYQAVVRDGANRLVVTTPVRVDVTITYSSGSYFESLRDTTNANGLMYVLIGGNPGFESINWENALIKTVVTIDGGETVTDEVAVTAVPYALQANYADSVNVDVIAHYIDSHALTNETDPTVPAWAKESTKPNYDYSEIQNTPDLTVYATNAHLNDTLADYTTNAHLNDTLGRYPTLKTLNDTLSHYPTLKTLNDTLSHYLMEEVQALRISNDTIYLTGGSFVKLPAGFSGDYNDLTHKPMKSDLCDSVKPCVTSWISDSTRMVFDTLHSRYTTLTTLSDTASHIRADIPTVPANVSAFTNDAGYLTSDSAVIVNLNTNVSNLQGDVTTLQTDVTNLQNADNLLSTRITTDSTNLANNYYNKTDLNDSLRRYATLKTLNDTLSHYLMEEVQALRISNDTIYLTGGSWVKLPKGFSGDYNDLTNRPDLTVYATNVHLDDTLSYYFDTTQVKTAIHDTADAIRAAIPAQVNADWNATSGKAEILNKPTIPTTVAELSDAANYATNAHLNDTLSHYYDTTQVNQTLKQYLKSGNLCDSVMRCTAIQAMQNDIVTNTTNIDVNKHAITDSSAHIRNDIKNGKITIALISGTETGVTNPTFGVNQDTNQTVTINIPEAATVNNGQLTIIAVGDTTRFTANQATNDTVRLDKFATKDTLKNFVNKLALRDSVNNIVKDSLAAPNSAINMAIDTIARHNISDSTRMVFDTLHKYYATKDTLKNFVNKLALRDSVNNIVKDSLAAPNSAINMAIDTIARHNISDSTRMVFDTLHKYYATKDTLKNFVNKLAIRDSVNNIVKDSLAAPNSAINLAIDTIARHNISDSTRMVFDTLHKYYATKDTLKNFVNKLALRDSVNNIVKDSLAAPNSAINHAIDTIARHNISDSTRMVFDTLHKYYATNAHLNDTLKYYTTSKQIDTLLGAYATKIALRDSTKMVFDTLHKYYATKDTLKNFVNKLALRDSVNNIVKDSLAAPNSAINLAIDTIARHNISDSTRMVFDTLHKYYATKDTLKNFVNRDALCDEVMACTDIKHMRDSIQKVNTRLTIDSTALANRMNAISDSVKRNLDTIRLNRKAIIDTAANIRNSIGDAQITITKNDQAIPNGSFNVNQKTPQTQTINIAVPTTVAELTDEANYAKVAANNQFTGTNTVPRGFVISGDNATTGDNCNNIVVNACDLWAVFDSMNRRMAALEADLAAMKAAMKSTTISASIVNSATTSNSIKVQATASNPAFEILSYEFCCSDCGDGITPVCTTITSNSYTFEGLNSYTDYHFTVKAYTFVDTVVSDTVPARTKAETPSAVPSVTALPIPQAGFSVDLSEIDLKGMPSGTVKVAYKLATASNYSNETTQNIDASTSTYNRTVASLASNTQYNVRIIVSNGDADTTFFETVTTGDAITLAITRVFPGTGNLSSCKVGNNSFQTHVLLRATPSAGNPEDYTYTWTTPTTPSGLTVVATANDSYYLVVSSLGSKNSATTYTVTCTATTKSAPNISLVPVTHSIQFKRTDREGNQITDFPEFSTNINDKTVTLYSPSGSDLFTDWVSWAADSIPEHVGSSPTHTYNSFGTYAISAYSENGCRTDESVTVLPSVNITNDHGSDPIGLCGESEVRVTYTAVPEVGEISDYEYQWSVSGGASMVPSSNSCEVTYSSAGTYTVSCNLTNATIPDINKEVNTTINAGSKPTLILCQENNSVTLKAHGDANWIDWDKDGETHSPYDNMSVTYTSPSMHTITIKNAAGCSTSQDVYIGMVHSFVPCNLTQIDPSGTHPAQETAATGVDITHNNDGMETVENGAITSITDYDGNVYPVVQIGSQCWLAENMRCTHSPSTGTNIVNPQGLSGNNAKGSCSFKTAHWYNNDPSSHGGVYGLLYDWCAAVDTYYVDGDYNETDWGVNTNFHSKGWPCTFAGHRRGICPKGWHVPTDAEWNVMEAEVGGSGTDYETTTGYRGSHAGKLAKDWCRWQSSTTSNAPGYISADRNSSYFSAVNTGYYSASTFSSSWIQYTRFWSASSYDNSNAWRRELNYNNAGVNRYGLTEKTNGLSVRCVRD